MLTHCKEEACISISYRHICKLEVKGQMLQALFNNHSLMRSALPVTAFHPLSALLLSSWNSPRYLWGIAHSLPFLLDYIASCSPLVPESLQRSPFVSPPPPHICADHTPNQRMWSQFPLLLKVLWVPHCLQGREIIHHFSASRGIYKLSGFYLSYHNHAFIFSFIYSEL